MRILRGSEFSGEKEHESLWVYSKPGAPGGCLTLTIGGSIREARIVDSMRRPHQLIFPQSHPSIILPVSRARIQCDIDLPIHPPQKCPPCKVMKTRSAVQQCRVTTKQYRDFFVERPHYSEVSRE